MIGSLKGKILIKQAPQVLIETYGIGYEIELPANTFIEMPKIGEEIFLYTHLQVRENEHTLFGFSNLNDRYLFRMLLKISGVGAKLALAILSAMSVSDFERCVRTEDSNTLVKIPGVGKKTAERLVLELGDKLSTWQMGDNAGVQASTVKSTPSVVSAQSEAESALVGLGYKPVQATKAVAAALRSAPDGSCEDLIRLSLKGMI